MPDTIPDYVKDCGKKYALPDPHTNQPRILTRTCNNFRLCSRCRDFRTNAHKEAINLILQKQQAYLLYADTAEGVKEVSKIVKELSEEDYRRYPLEGGGLALLVLDNYKDREYMTYTLDSELVDYIVDHRGLVETPERKRISGKLYQTNERGKKDDNGNTIPISISCPDVVIKSDKDAVRANRALAKTFLQTAGWRPDPTDIEAHMQAFQDVLEKNYVAVGLSVRGRDRFRLRIDPEQINWVGYDREETVMSILDNTVGSYLLDLIRSGAANEIEKLPAPTEFGLIFSGWRTT